MEEADTTEATDGTGRSVEGDADEVVPHHGSRDAAALAPVQDSQEARGKQSHDVDRIGQLLEKGALAAQQGHGHCRAGAVEFLREVHEMALGTSGVQARRDNQDPGQHADARWTA